MKYYTIHLSLNIIVYTNQIIVNKNYNMYIKLVLHSRRKRYEGFHSNYQYM